MPQPVIQELLPVPAVTACFERMRALPYCLWLDSARYHQQLGRYSFMMADPVQVVQRTINEERVAKQRGEPELLTTLQELIASRMTATMPGLPPFQGGLAGMLSYDLAQGLEQLPAAAVDEFAWPSAVVGLYDVVLAWDHVEQRAWLISQGWRSLQPQADQQRAQERCDAFQRLLTAPREQLPELHSTWQASSIDLPVANALAIQPQVLKTTEYPGIFSNFTRHEYLAAVDRTIEYIRAGDVFQVNLAQRLLTVQREPAWQTYLRLREANPATFGGYFAAADWQLLSASPERLLQVQAGLVETRPIKGTRPRSKMPEADLFRGAELLASDKDRAENIMIVDLLRNDLSAVCAADSVRVTELCRLEVYEYVQHLVSVVQGRLASPHTIGDLLRAVWPGGSITGAPKIRAQQIITELEKVARGPYCGSLFYWGADQSADLNLLIRTILVRGGWCQFSVGGGITTASEPAREYEETWHKAQGLLRALV